jgi:hypothetical protein
MSDETRTKRRRDAAAARHIARYGEANHRRRSTVAPMLRSGGSVDFSSPGLALIGLRRRKNTKRANS